MKKEYAVDRETATKEVEGWLDTKKVSLSKRESKKDSIENLICAVMDGDLSLNEKGEFEQKLKFPPSDSVQQLTFKQRIIIGDVQHHIRNNKISITDFDGRIICYVQALTGQPNAVLSKLESTDYDVAYSLAVFFM